MEDSPPGVDTRRHARHLPPNAPSVKPNLTQLWPMAHEAPIHPLTIYCAHAYDTNRLFPGKTIWFANSTSQTPGAPRDH
eukprot:6672718-Pyramimonas_sp.AAC.1